jgi:NAD(P)-dependent dehydrogenase (short-subunit alcohol dehydrogenase family)
MKNVVITGAGRGIGLALTKQFAQSGYYVLGTYRDEKSAKNLLKLAQESENVTAVTADVTDEKSFAAFQNQLKKLENIDILINNSGVIGDKASGLADLDLKKVAEVFEVNTFGPMRVSRTVLPFMKKNSVIAQITSLMGSIADSSGGYYDYRMSKAALNMFNMCLSKEYTDVTCLVLHPGWVQTDMGGAGASVTTENCAEGLFKVITTATLKQTGNFYDFKGKQLPW